MKRSVPVLVGLFVAAGAAAAPTPGPGWDGVVPELTGYARTFEAPRVDKGKAPAYRQVVKYEWTGGALKSLTATLERSPAFKKEHAPARLRGLVPAPREVRLGKKTGWLWAKEGGGGKLLVPLDDDKALVLEAKGMLIAAELTALAGRFDLEALTAALARPPRTDARRGREGR
jgi:hypothetical protein